MKPDLKAEILNDGLDMSMAFGPDWLKPIQERLGKKYPEITEEKLDEYNQICSKARDDGNDFIYRTLEKMAELKQTITSADLEYQLKTFMTTKYLWISKENLNRLFSQGCYYAWKDGLTEGIQG